VAAFLAQRRPAPAQDPSSSDRIEEDDETEGDSEPEPLSAPEPPRERQTAEPTPRQEPEPEPEPTPQNAPPSRQVKAKGRVLHTADPCSHQPPVQVPAGHDTTTALGVTVALPRAGVPFIEPTVLAHLAAGLLEEAASVTGTARRSELTLIVYPTEDEFRATSGAPRWASGFYDGAVKLPALPHEDLGVRLSSLRHEVMHAQLHAGAGCMPVWLNEGAASYFSGRPRIDAWIDMLRRRRVIDLPSLQVSTVEEVRADSTSLVYGQSLAMVLYAIERSEERSLEDAVRALRELDESARGAGGRALWSHLFPGVTERDLLVWLGVRMFGVRPGSTLDGILAGAVCCQSGSRIHDFSCYGAPARPDKRVWFDESRSPVALCRND
jgi:hypothetical protein